MDPDVPLVVSEVNPDALARATGGHHRQPELHDDGRDAAAQGAARRVRPARAWSPRATRPRAAPGRRASTSSPPRCPSAGRHRRAAHDGATAMRRVEHSVHAEHARLQRRAAARALGDDGLHRRGAEAPQRVAQDPRPAGPGRLADVRARAGLHRPLRRDHADVRAPADDGPRPGDPGRGGRRRARPRYRPR